MDLNISQDQYNEFKNLYIDHVRMAIELDSIKMLTYKYIKESEEERFGYPVDEEAYKYMIDRLYSELEVQEKPIVETDVLTEDSSEPTTKVEESSNVGTYVLVGVVSAIVLVGGFFWVKNRK